MKSSKSSSSKSAPSYIPPGWTEKQTRAREPNFALLDTLSPDELRLWAAGQSADRARELKKKDALPRSPPSYIPDGWTTAQAICPSFEMLSALPEDELAKFITAHSELLEVSRGEGR